MRLRQPALAIGAALALVVSGCGSESEPSGSTTGDTSTNSSGACASPYLSADQSTAAAGADVELRGTDFIDGCTDTDSVPRVTPRETSTPEADVALTFNQGETTEVLATVDADSQGRLRTTVTIPSDASPGEATITADVQWVNAVTIDITG